MKIGILEAGEPPPSLALRFGTYVAMTRRLLGDAHAYETFRVAEGEMPAVEQCEAYVITGSACSVYENRPWIAELEAFLRSARGRAGLVGICFGHQILAQAFGGKVEKAPQGWGLGLHRYEMRERAVWMDDGVEAVYATASHQDQVTRLPPTACVLGASALTPHAILSYQDCRAISVQFHPEFEPDFSRALFAARRAPDLTDEDLSHAIASMAGANDNLRLGRWINRFLSD